MFGLNPWLIIGAIVSMIAVGGGGYLKGGADARARCQTAALKVEKAALEAENAELRRKAAVAANLADQYAEKLRIDAELDRLNQDRANDTPENATACLPRDAAGRVRDIR